jgi:hypothetical protein
MADNLTSKVPLPSIVHLGPGGGVALTAFQGRFKECTAADYVPEEGAEPRYREPLRGPPDSPKAPDTIRRREYAEVLRGDDESVKLHAKTRFCLTGLLQ